MNKTKNRHRRRATDNESAATKGDEDYFNSRAEEHSREQSRGGQTTRHR